MILVNNITKHNLNLYLSKPRFSLFRTTMAPAPVVNLKSDSVRTGTTHHSGQPPIFAIDPETFLYTFNTWYDGLPPDSRLFSLEQAKKWFGVGSVEERTSFDKVCIDGFLPLLKQLYHKGWEDKNKPATYEEELAMQDDLLAMVFGVWSSWWKCVLSVDPDEEQITKILLGCILLLDQMPRNCYRKEQHKIYGYFDYISRATLRSFLAENRYDKMGNSYANPIRRMFWYLPFSHSEHLEDHKAYKKYMDELWQEIESTDLGSDKDNVVAGYETIMKAEAQHLAILEKYGRYPHRNKVLGRESTEEEVKFLKDGGATFGAHA